MISNGILRCTRQAFYTNSDLFLRAVEYVTLIKRYIKAKVL